MSGFNVAERGHVVPLIFPRDVNTGVTADVFSMRDWSHATIIFVLGATAGAPTKLFIKQCTDKASAGATAIAFHAYSCETTGGAANCDVLGVRVPTASTGLTLAATDNIFYVVELEASELSPGYEWVEVSCTAAAAVNMACAVAVLSGGRDTKEASRTVLDN